PEDRRTFSRWIELLNPVLSHIGPTLGVLFSNSDIDAPTQTAASEAMVEILVRLTDSDAIDAVSAQAPPSFFRDLAAESHRRKSPREAVGMALAAMTAGANSDSFR